MNKETKNLFKIIFLLISSVTFTFLTKIIDVKPVGIDNTDIGFSSINLWFFHFTGVNMFWYHFTDWLGIIPVLLALCYAIIGLVQWIKRKSLLKVDKEIIAIGIFYLVVIGVYIFFELYIVNYRPILIDGYTESSYPSSHTLMTVCLCGSAILANNSMLKKRTIINSLLVLVASITVIGRLISGVHWLTDIIGGAIISVTLLFLFFAFLQKLLDKD